MAKNQVLTPPGIGSFLTLQKPRAITPEAEPRYSLSIIFDKAAQARPEFANLQKAVDQAAKQRWPNKLPYGLQSPFHDGAEKAGVYTGYHPGDIFISPWSKKPPGCINARKEDIIDSAWDDVWSGWLVRANVVPFAYDTAGKRGVTLFLESVQFLRPGERLDGRRPPQDQFPDDGEGEGDELV